MLVEGAELKLRMDMDGIRKGSSGMSLVPVKFKFPHMKNWGVATLAITDDVEVVERRLDEEPSTRFNETSNHLDECSPSHVESEVRSSILDSFLRLFKPKIQWLPRLDVVRTWFATICRVYL